MLPDRVSNPGPLTYESGALPIALRHPADKNMHLQKYSIYKTRDVASPIVIKLFSVFN